MKKKRKEKKMEKPITMRKRYYGRGLKEMN